MKENFMYFMKRLKKLNDRGFRGSQIDVLQLGNFLHFFDKFGKNENINFYIFLCNSNKN